MKHKQLYLLTAALSSSLLLSSSFAAQLVDLSKQSANTIKPFLTDNGANQLTFLRAHQDFNGTKHVRMQQTYLGYRVFGGDIIVHIAKDPNNSKAGFSASQLNARTTMNGVVFQQLEKDLVPVQADRIAQQAERAAQMAIDNFQSQDPSAKIETKAISNERIVYVDQHNKAHWAYKVVYNATLSNDMPARPTYIIDADEQTIYEKWDDIQTANGGGFGGNPKMGQLIYDGGTDHLPILNVTKSKNVCYLKNSIVHILDVRNNATITYPCQQVDPDHNKTYWNGSLDQANGGYSPSNDALNGMLMVDKLYKSWFKMPVLTQNGKPMLLVGRVHDHQDNAYWDGKQMTYGDGVTMFYPLTVLDVDGHEISHGFTQQQSGLQYRYQAGGLNESFSDMAGEATEYYALGKNDFLIGADIMKRCNNPNFCALRSMQTPRIDGRSIDHLSQYRDGIDVHYSSGIFNKAFYLLATTKNWNTKKAFSVMAKANMDYWTSNTTFLAAACGVVKAATDYKYDLTAVRNALDQVGLNTSSC